MGCNTDRLNNLLKRQSTCFWCGVKVVRHFGPNRPPNMATVDHLHPRGHPLRGQTNKCATVLACLKCNQDHNRAFQQGITLVWSAWAADVRA